MSKHYETPQERELVLLPLSEGVDEEGLDNGILWTIKLHVQIKRGFEAWVLELREQQYPMWARPISYKMHCLEVSIQTGLFNLKWRATCITSPRSMKVPICPQWLSRMYQGSSPLAGMLESYIDHQDYWLLWATQKVSYNWTAKCTKLVVSSCYFGTGWLSSSDTIPSSTCHSYTRADVPNCRSWQTKGWLYSRRRAHVLMMWRAMCMRYGMSSRLLCGPPPPLSALKDFS